MVGKLRTAALVDDDAAMRRLVRMRLEETGQFQVIGEGSDGRIAVELARQHRPDVMVLDVTMPGTDGLTALPDVLAASPKTRVVLLTALADPQLAARAFQLGAADVLAKSAGVEALCERLTAPRNDSAAGESPAFPAEMPAGAVVAAAETKRTVVAQELRQGEDRYRSLVEAVQDYAIFMLGVDGTVITWNAGAARIKGYSADEIIGRHFREFYPPEAQQRRHPEHELELALRDGHYEEEGWRIRKDGSRFWANVLITAVYNTAGVHIGFAKITRNMDERRQMLLALEAAGAALAAANAELEAANEQLSLRAQEQAEFVAVTAHELRNPISVLTGSAAMLVQHFDQMDETDRGELVSSITATSHRLERLLADLLTASRLESHAIELRTQLVDVGTLLAQSVAAARAGSPAADVRLDAEAGRLTATADPDRLAQAVDNLIANALRHGAEPVHVAARADGDRVLLTVTDAGPGVPEELRSRLFHRFAAGRRRGGTGLGLFIVRELARAHGGDAWYEPHAAGARFGLSIPAAPPGTDTLVTGCTTTAPKQA
jgi:PAS domain S-box-containing protein